MTTTTLERSTEPTTTSPSGAVAPTVQQSATATATRGTAALVGLCFLTATFAFAIGTARIHSFFSNVSSHNSTLIAGVLLLGCHGLADAANGLVMRPILAPRTPIRSQAYRVLRAAECLTVVAIGVYFLTSQTRWDAYVLPIYALSGAAGLVLSSALLTSRIVPRNLSMLGVIGYPVFLVGTILAMFSVIDVTHGAGTVALVPGGLFELILPIWLFAKGFASHQIDAS